ncbi:preprotein translocase subunit SecE [Myxosarcina sp. GI1]|uniref:preprotein translocase subunit SecE n=1 Tax=Myxosarcina sp. GI1 TaxID=1541065 RepID=UPI000564398A|nr:preprotein translocase subunit SecE [Myxosarcina sp. GI1]
MAKKNTAPPTKNESKEAGGGSNLAQFAVETRQELSKVVWPSRQQLIGESAAVILMVILVSTLIYLINSLFAWGAGKIF